MDVTVEASGGALVVRPHGRLDSSTAPEFESRLLGHVDGAAGPVVLDLGGVAYISTAGLRVLLVAARRLRGGNRRLIVCGLGAAVRDAFEISGFITILDVRATVTDALAALR
jgi:anti-anti-sigma factor